MKVLKLAVMVVFTCLVIVTPVMAYKIDAKKDKDGKAIEIGGPDSPAFSGAAVGAGLGAALTIVGAGYGFGRIGASALESMARQPEVAGRVQTAMLIIAALLEGATFFSLIICIQIADRAIW